MASQSLTSSRAYHDFATRDVMHFEFSTSDTRCVLSPMRVCELTFSYPVTSIEISAFAGSRIRTLMNLGLSFSRSPIQSATCLLTCSTMAHTPMESREIAYRDIAIPVALVHGTLQVPNPDMVNTCPPLKCYNCGVVVFRGFATPPVMIFSSLRIPICRSPMHVRAYSSTSPLPRRPIGYHGIAIPEATISSLPEFTMS
jgi:hypothetical protein